MNGCSNIPSVVLELRVATSLAEESGFELVFPPVTFNILLDPVEMQKENSYFFPVPVPI